jgi:Glycosyltransferase 61
MSKILISHDSSCRRRTAPTGIIHVLLIVAFLTLLNVRIDGRFLFKWSSTTTKNNYPRTFLVGLSPSIVTNITTTGCKTLNQHAGVAASISTPRDGEMWCVLDPNNTVQFKHFPHASQALLPCWSWFQRMRESGGSNMSCGFYVKPDLKVSRWPAELIKLMGCSVTYEQPPFTGSGKKKNKTMILHYDEVAGRGLTWFEKPEDAAVLRSRLLDRLELNSTWRHLSSAEQHHQQTITIVNRKGTRRLVNVDNITSALREAYPSALIQTLYMEDMAPMEQFALWSQQSIVIAPHGAGLTNSMFLPPGNASAVIEIFPRHYFAHGMFGSLLRSCGIRRYGYYDNESDPAADWKVYGSTREQRRFYRSVDLEPPVDDILGLVRKALMDGRQNIFTGF